MIRKLPVIKSAEDARDADQATPLQELIYAIHAEINLLSGALADLDAGKMEETSFVGFVRRGVDTLASKLDDAEELPID
jgi:hypothetical protein